jgi:FkbM family methyltransferase
MKPAQRLARRLGYDLTPRRKAKSPNAQLVAVLARFRITCVLDVGANVGQYGAMLRDWGYRGRIVSFEPQAAAHAALERRAAADPGWQVAPPMALGASNGQIELQVSAEPDMSSILPQSALLRQVSPSAAVVRRETVPLRRLDEVAGSYLGTDDCVFLKADTQGYESDVLAGAGPLLDRLAGIQLELSLVPIYEGERDFRAMLGHLAALGFEPYLFLPGYFERKLARQLQVDGVFMRAMRDRGRFVIRREPRRRWRKFLWRAMVFAARGSSVARRACPPTSIPILIKSVMPSARLRRGVAAAPQALKAFGTACKPNEPEGYRATMIGRANEPGFRPTAISAPRGLPMVLANRTNPRKVARSMICSNAYGM